MSTGDIARMTQQYTPAHHRDGCRNCAFGKCKQAEPDWVVWRCQRGGFAVSAMAICARFERNKVPQQGGQGRGNA